MELPYPQTRLVLGGGSLAADILGFQASVWCVPRDSWRQLWHHRSQGVSLEEEEGDTEHHHEELTTLPIFTTDPSTLHFGKKPSYRSELHSLRLCKDLHM